MSKTLKILLTSFIITVIAIICFVGFGLYAMEIEDTYGDYQNIFYNTNEGDIIFLENNKRVGTIKKSWKRINILFSDSSIFSLFEFMESNHDNLHIKIYSSNNGNYLKSIRNYKDLNICIQEDKVKLVFEGVFNSLE